jgi:hypothetical protein
MLVVECVPTELGAALTQRGENRRHRHRRRSALLGAGAGGL